MFGLLIILVGVTVTWYSEKVTIFTKCDFMPESHKKILNSIYYWTWQQLHSILISEPNVCNKIKVHSLTGSCMFKRNILIYLSKKSLVYNLGKSFCKLFFLFIQHYLIYILRYFVLQTWSNEYLSVDTPSYLD